jgi:hypothetical protein
MKEPGLSSGRRNGGAESTITREIDLSANGPVTGWNRRRGQSERERKAHIQIQFDSGLSLPKFQEEERHEEPK